ncbi:MAG: TetR/AcrR family transcriptional regulator [Eubacterium sp.]|nr:TetR/AcrR family transcriptional regulator [Eubacterium sp.]
MASKYTNRDLIIEGTIRCARKNGLSNVTMKTIGKEVGILGQGLYNHFENKEEVLNCCFEYCEKKIASLYNNYELDLDKDLMDILKEIWMIYFNYFVENPNENSFYRQFREAVRFSEPVKPSQEKDVFKSVNDIIDKIVERYPKVFSKVERNIVMAYVQFITPVFAQMYSDGKINGDEKTREELWNMISKGFGAFEY